MSSASSTVSVVASSTASALSPTSAASTTSVISTVTAASATSAMASTQSIEKGGVVGPVRQGQEDVVGTVATTAKDVGNRALEFLDQTSNTLFGKVGPLAEKGATVVSEKALSFLRDEKGDLEWKKVAICGASILLAITLFGYLNNYCINEVLSGPVGSLVAGTLNGCVFIGGTALYLVYKYKRVKQLEAEIEVLKESLVANGDRIKELEAKIRREKREAGIAVIVGSILSVISVLAIPGVVSAKVVAAIGSWSFTAAMAVVVYEIYKRM